MTFCMIIIYIAAAIIAFIGTKLTVGTALRGKFITSVSNKVNTIVVFLLLYFATYITLYSIYLVVMVCAGLIGVIS